MPGKRAVEKPGRWRLVLVAAFILVATSLGVSHAQLFGSLPMGAPAATDSEGEECASGVAVSVDGDQMICSDFCAEDSDCAALANAGCRSVYQGNGERVSLCFPYRVAVGP